MGQVPPPRHKALNTTPWLMSTCSQLTPCSWVILEKLAVSQSLSYQFSKQPESQSLLHTFSQMNAAHKLPPYFIKLHFNIILSSTTTSPKWSLRFRLFGRKFCMHFSSLLRVLHARPIMSSLIRQHVFSIPSAWTRSQLVQPTSRTQFMYYLAPWHWSRFVINELSYSRGNFPPSPLPARQNRLKGISPAIPGTQHSLPPHQDPHFATTS